VGHEVDVSVADLVADYHAHTPTEAAQVVVRHWRAAPELVDTSAVRLARSVRGMVQDARRQLANIERHEMFRTPKMRLYMFRQLMDDREKALALLVGDRLRGFQHGLRDFRDRLDRHHPSLLIARGRETLQAIEQRLHTGELARLKDLLDGLARFETMLVERHPRHRVRLERERLAALESRLRRAGAESLHRRLHRLEALGRQLEAVGPEQVLRRGYSITIRKKTREVVRSVSQIKPGDRMLTRFADGEVEWTAEDSKQLPLFPS
jgi:exodeoxyribonuclease VII large subunit